MEALNKLEALVIKAKEEAERFYTKGNKTAGTRLRGLMMQIKTAATEVRADVISVKSEPKVL